MEKQTLEQAIKEFTDNYWVDFTEFVKEAKTKNEFEQDLTSLIQLAQRQQGKEIKQEQGDWNDIMIRYMEIPLNKRLGLSDWLQKYYNAPIRNTTK